MIELAIRLTRDNENHHLWNNNGTWFVHYTVYPTRVTKQRIRFSLKTKNLDKARRLRDDIFAKFETHPEHCIVTNGALP